MLFIAPSSAAHGRRAVSVWESGPAARFNCEGPLGQWMVWWTATLDLDAGDAAVAPHGSASSTYFNLYLLFVLCTLYVVLC